MRCFHILKQLSYHHQVHLICHQSAGDFHSQVGNYNFPNSPVIYSSQDHPPPSSFFHFLPKRIGPGLHYRYLRRSWDGPAEETLLACYHLLKEVLQTHTIDCVVFEHLSSMMMAPLVRRLCPKASRILDAHNVDHKLFTEEWKKKGITRRRKRIIAQTEYIESHLSSYVNGFWACSQEDCDYLEKNNTIQGWTIPNGVDTTYFSFDAREEKSLFPNIIFSGWFGTIANQDGLRYFVEDIFPLVREKLPQVQLLVVGGGMPAFLQESLHTVSNIRIIGEVPDIRPYCQEASLSLVPLRVGSGTRLKILEGMSQGNPIVSTRKGAEGIPAKDGQHFLLADSPAEFVASILRLLSDRNLFDKIRYQARSFIVDHFDWKVIGRAIEKSLLEIIPK